MFSEDFLLALNYFRSARYEEIVKGRIALAFIHKFVLSIMQFNTFETKNDFEIFSYEKYALIYFMY